MQETRPKEALREETYLYELYALQQQKGRENKKKRGNPRKQHEENAGAQRLRRKEKRDTEHSHSLAAHVQLTLQE